MTTNEPTDEEYKKLEYEQVEKNVLINLLSACRLCQYEIAHSIWIIVDAHDIPDVDDLQEALCRLTSALDKMR